MLNPPLMRSVSYPLFSLILACTIAAAEPPLSNPQSGWAALSRMDSDKALASFSSTAASRQTRLGHALALLGSTNNSPSKLAPCRRELIALRDEDPHDDSGIAATFYLARIAQHFDGMIDPQAAINTYRTLLADHPGHPIAELAAPKLAIALLYADVSDQELQVRFTKIAALIPNLRHITNQRDTRLILADALLRLTNDHARAYQLITWCLERDLIHRASRLNNYLLQAGESARILGHETEAIAYYQRYIKSFPRDNKTDEIRRRLRILEQRHSDA